MSNGILKYFNPDQDVEKSKDFLYVSLVVSKNDIRSKNVKYVKVCVMKSSSLLKPNIEATGYEKSNQNMLYRSNSELIGQFKFEDQPISLNLEDSAYQEITNILPIQDVINNISIMSYFGHKIEVDHTFKIYFLDKDKRIVEKKEFKRPEGRRIDDYAPVVFDDVIENTLQSSINIDLRDYNEDFLNGPFVSYNDALNNIEEFELEKVNISIDFNRKMYNFSDASLLSRSMISTYKSGIIFDLKKYFDLNQEENVLLNVYFNYKNLSIKKSILMTRLKLQSLYSSYFKRFKSSFIKDAFKNKIEANLNRIQNLSSLKLKFVKPELNFLPISEESLKISITKNVNAANTRISNLYTTESLSEDSKIISAANFEFNFQSIYNNSEESGVSVFYVKCPYAFLQWANVIIKVNNEIVYPTNLTSNSNDYVEDNQTTESKVIDFFGKNVLKKQKVSNDGIKSLIDYEKINQNSNSLKRLGYKTDNNDYLAQNIINNTIVKYVTRETFSNGEIIEKIQYDRMSNIIDEDKILIKSKKNKNKSKRKVSLSTITLPDDLLDKITSINESTDDDKESVATYLNNAIPGNYRKIDALIKKDLFSNSSNKKEKDIFQSIFDIKKDNLNFIIAEDENENTNLEEESNITEEEVIESDVEPGEILDISSFSTDYDVFFKSFLYYKPQQNYLKVFKRKCDRIIATLDVTKILEEISVNPSDSISFNVEKLITLEFDENNFTTNEALNDFVYDNNKIIIDGSYFIFKNITSLLKDKILYIKNNSYEEVIEITEDTYEKFYNIWGNNNTLYINNILERYVITIFVNNRIKKSIQINNYIEKDFSLIDSIEQRTYVLNSDLHMPNIKVELKRPRGDN